MRESASAAEYSKSNDTSRRNALAASSGLSTTAFFSSESNARNAGCRFALRAPSPPVRHLLSILDLDGVVPVEDHPGDPR